MGLKPLVKDFVTEFLPLNFILKYSSTLLFKRGALVVCLFLAWQFILSGNSHLGQALIILLDAIRQTRRYLKRSSIPSCLIATIPADCGATRRPHSHGHNRLRIIQAPYVLDSWQKSSPKLGTLQLSRLHVLDIYSKIMTPYWRLKKNVKWKKFYSKYYIP